MRATLGKLLGVAHTLTTYRWIVQSMEKTQEPVVSGDIKEMEFDEMWHYVIGKSGTVFIERDNSNTRHHLGRMTRRTKVVSKK